MSSPAFIFIETLYLGIRKIIHKFHFQMSEFDCLNVGLLSFVFSAYKKLFYNNLFFMQPQPDIGSYKPRHHTVPAGGT